MGKPLPLPPLPPASSSGSGRPADVPTALWGEIVKAATKHGVTPQVLAGIWRVESGSTYPNAAVNSSGYGGLFGTTKWNASTAEQADYAASILRNLIAQKGNLHDALLAYSGNGYSSVPGVTVPRTPAQKAQDEGRDASAKAGSPAYIQATTDLSVVKSQAVAAAKATAHISDPWITVTKKGGKVTGFSESTGGNAPANVLLIGGVPATKSLFDQQWGATYSNDFQAFTGRLPTPGEQADILSRGLSVYQLRTELSKRPTFLSSPAYRQSGPGAEENAKQVLGVAPPKDFVRQAIAQNWDAATFDANLRKLPQYTSGPVYKQAALDMTNTYQSIYGPIPKAAPDMKPGAPTVADDIKQHVLAGWKPTEYAMKLRQQPQYKYSPEAHSNALNFLDGMGLLIGSRPTLTPGPSGKLTPQLAGAAGAV